MQKILVVVAMCIVLAACNTNGGNNKSDDNKELATMLDQYYEETLQLFPLSATGVGDNRYNDLLYADFTESYRIKLKEFSDRYLNEIKKFDREKLNQNDQISYDIFKREMEMNIEGLTFKDNYIPFNQFYALPLSLGQMGSGEGNQPFKTIKDYDDWIKRATAFSAWTDSAIVYFKKGMETGFVLPKSIVVKMVPQMQAMVTDSAQSSLFYGPVTKMPADFSDADKQRLTTAYIKLINEQIVPSYKKLAVFLNDEYLPKARATSGINAVPDGDKYYAYLVRQQTTTNK